MAIPDVLVTLRFRLVVEILLWNCGLRLKVYSTFVAYLYSFAFFFFFLAFRILRSVWFRWISVPQTSRANIFFTYLSCDRELNSPKLYRCRSLISFEKHFAFRYSPKSAIARACLVSRRIIRSQRVQPEIVVRISTDRAIFLLVLSDSSKRIAKNSNRKKRAE